MSASGMLNHDARPVCRKLSGACKLRLSREFSEAFDGGVSHVGRYMVMWLRQAEDASLRLGVIASKRTFRRSVDRTRAKRLIRESYRLNRYQLHGAVDVVIVARKRVLEASFKDIQRDLLKLCRKAGLL